MHSEAEYSNAEVRIFKIMKKMEAPAADEPRL